MQTLDYTVAVKFMNSLSCFVSVLICQYKLSLPAVFHLHFSIFINITVSMTCNCNRACPSRNIRCNTLYEYRCSENSAIQNSSDSTVRRFPHLCQIIFRHSCSIRSNCSTLYCYTIFLSSFCAVKGHLVLGLFSVIKTKIVVLCIKVDIRFKKNFLNPLPEYSCHLIAVHFNERRFHLNLCHWFFLLYII